MEQNLDQTEKENTPETTIDSNPISSPIESETVESEEVTDSLVEAVSEAADNQEFVMTLDYADAKEQEDLQWKEATGLDENSLSGAIETIIFLSDRPVTVNRIRDNISPTLPLRVIYESIQKLQSEYEKAHHGIRLFELGEGFQFKTKAMYSKYVQDLFKAGSVTLSSTALEVLAIVAYKQPVSRIEIEKIRGVDSSHIIRNLMDKRLVKVEGRSEEIGKPATYVTTVEFLEMFNIKCLEDLPPEIELETLANQKEVGEIKDIKNLVAKTNEVKEKFTFDEMEELDALATEIKEISPETEFTKSWKDEDKKKKNPELKNEAKSAFDLIEDFVFNAPEAIHEEVNLDGSQVDGINGIIADQLTDEQKQTIQDLKNQPPVFTETTSEELESIQVLGAEVTETRIEESEKVESLETEEFENTEQDELETALDEAFEKLMGNEGADTEGNSLQ